MAAKEAPLGGIALALDHLRHRKAQMSVLRVLTQEIRNSAAFGGLFGPTNDTAQDHMPFQDEGLKPPPRLTG